MSRSLAVVLNTYLAHDLVESSLPVCIQGLEGGTADRQALVVLVAGS